jgi:hypothetical protein
MRTAAIAALAVCAAWAGEARGEPTAAPPAGRLAALVPADDARRAIAIGHGGEVYEPDGNGAWIRRLPCTTATPVIAAGRAGAAIVALGDGVIYRLAANGWSAIRLMQHGKAILGAGPRALAAVGRQLFALDPLARGEPTRLAQAPAAIVAIGAGPTAAVIATESALFRLAGNKLVALPGAPAAPRPISDRWWLIDRAAADLSTGRLTRWPDDLRIGPAAAGPGDALAAVGRRGDGLVLVTIAAGKLALDPLGITGEAVGVVVDRAGRAVVALDDGRLAMRGPAGWTTTTVVDEPAAAHPGAAPAISK